MKSSLLPTEAAVTIFDRILSGEIPAAVVHDDEHVLAFKDVSPQATVHILVIPKKKTRNLSEAAQWSPEKLGAFFISVAAVAKKIGLHESGYRVVLNTGRDGGQTVDYLHAHILGGEPLGRFGVES